MSRLALVQSHHVGDLLAHARTGLTTELVHFSTKGDRTLNRPLPEIGGKGLFTAELEQALLDGAIDIAVHSLKDLPTEQNSSLAVGAVVQRADAHDCLVAKNAWTLDRLPAGAVIGTSSPRRRARNCWPTDPTSTSFPCEAMSRRESGARWKRNVTPSFWRQPACCVSGLCI